MTAPVRVGLVGTGGIAAVHADNVARLDGRAAIVAATDIDRDRLDEFADRWGIPRRADDLTTLIAGGDLDIVHLCSPPGLHAAQAVELLEAGIDVLCEKPPALSLAELDRIGEAERRGGARFATVSQHRFGGRALWLRELISEGALGPLMTAVCHTLWYRPDSYFELPWRGVWDQEGGGPTLGHGIHQMDTMLSFVAPWREVVAVAARRARPVETEDLSAAVVTLDDGAVVSIVNSLLSPRETSYLRLDFELATIELEHLYGYGDANWRVTPAPGAEDVVAALAERGPHGAGSGHAAQFEAVIAARESGSPIPVDLTATRRTFELITAIYASAFTGERVSAGAIDAGSPFYASLRGSGPLWDPAG